MIAYLSGPITGMPQQNKPAFTRASDSLRESGYGVLNPFDLFAEPAPVNPTREEKRAYWQRAMRACLRVLPDADVIAVLPGWERSEGAREEHRIATQVFGMRVIYLTTEAPPLADEEVA